MPRDGKKVVKGRGKFFRMDATIDFVDVYAVFKNSPKFRLAVMHDLGRFANKLLVRKFLSNSVEHGTLKYTKEIDSAGNYLVRNYVVSNKKYNQVRMTSYPLNPFEFGRAYNPPYDPAKRPASRGPVTHPWKARKKGKDKARGILTELFPIVLANVLPAEAQIVVEQQFNRLYGKV